MRHRRAKHNDEYIVLEGHINMGHDPIGSQLHAYHKFMHQMRKKVNNMIKHIR